MFNKKIFIYYHDIPADIIWLTTKYSAYSMYQLIIRHCLRQLTKNKDIYFITLR